MHHKQIFVWLKQEISLSRIYSATTFSVSDKIGYFVFLFFFHFFFFSRYFFYDNLVRKVYVHFSKLVSILAIVRWYRWLWDLYILYIYKSKHSSTTWGGLLEIFYLCLFVRIFYSRTVQTRKCAKMKTRV